MSDKPDWRPNSDALVPNFWVDRRLKDFNEAEWEALCDGCGQCCLVKLIDEDDERMYVTDVACRGYDCKNGGCAVYDRRKSVVPERTQPTRKKGDADGASSLAGSGLALAQDSDEGLWSDISPET